MHAMSAKFQRLDHSLRETLPANPITAYGVFPPQTGPYDIILKVPWRLGLGSSVQ
jgi:hypothetical protein